MTLFDIAKKNVTRDWREYVLHFANSLFAVTVLFLFMSLALHPEMGRVQVGSTIGIIAIGSSLLVGVFSLGFIAYSESCFLRARSRQFGLMSILGASIKQLRRMVMIENLIIGVGAILAGIALGTVLLKLFLTAAGKAMGTVEFNFYLPLVPTAITTLLFSVIFVVAGVLGGRQLSSKTVSALLKADRVAEAAPSPLRAGIALGIFMACALGGYWLDLQGENLMWSLVFFIGIAGGMATFSYLLFLGVIAVRTRIQRTNGSYYEGNTMLKHAALVERLRGNLQSMTVTAVLCAGSFFALVFLYPLMDGALDQAKSVTPFAVSYAVHHDGVPEAEQLALLNQVMSAKPDIRAGRFTLQRFDKQRNAVMSVDDYNTAAAVAGRPHVQVQPGQAVLVAGSANQKNLQVPSDLDAMMGQPLQVIQTEPNIVLDGYVTTLTVLHAEDLARVQAVEAPIAIAAYHYSGWEHDRGLATELAALEPFAARGDISLVQARTYYESDRVQFSLLLYLGSFLSLSFLLASASLLYSRLHARARAEGERYAAIVKVGLSRQSLSGICWSLVLQLIALPLAVALAYMWVGVGLVAAFTQVPILWPALIFSLLVAFIGAAGITAAGQSYTRTVTAVAFGTA